MSTKMIDIEIEKIYKMLKSEITEEEIGRVVFSYHNIDVVLNDKSPIGYILQEWLGKWLTTKNILFSTNPNTQEPPDFFIGRKRRHLELKTFDYEAGANFDIANFEAYCALTKSDPSVLDADYLILGYTLHDGDLKIKNMWLKKIWEISCPSERFPIKTQVKRDMIYNIRPACWYSKSPNYRPFKSKKEFVLAVYETLKKYPKTTKSADDWFKAVSSAGAFK